MMRQVEKMLPHMLSYWFIRPLLSLSFDSSALFLSVLTRIFNIVVALIPG